MDIEDATTTFSSPARTSIAASRTTAAPIAFTEVYRSISYIDWPTPTAAARCTSRSTPVQRPLHGVAVADVALDPFDIGSQIVGPAAGEPADRASRAPARRGRPQQAIDEVRADEAGATCDEDMDLDGG